MTSKDEKVSGNGDGVPVIDMSQEDASVATQLIEAFTTIGFATLTNHGVENDTISNAFQASKSFFSLSLEEKLRYKFQGYESNRGYIPMGCETHDGTENMKPDKKETFDIGNEQEEGFENKWPTAELSEKFRNDILSYFDSFDSLHLRIMRLIAIGLGCPDENLLVKLCDGRHENMRLLHYPSCLKSDSSAGGIDNGEPVIRGNVHTDFGTITLLTQDDVGGLRAQRLDGSWVSVPPVKGSIVVNVGDMLQRWSNDTLRATPHQVVDTVCCDTQEAKNIPERYSVAFFCNASKETLLECLEQCTSEEKAAKYPPINAHEYLTLRLSQTIAKEASS